MSTELALTTSVADLEVISEKVSKSSLFGLSREQAFALCMLAEAEGLHPIEAVRRWHIIEGRPAMRADAMQAEFQRHGGRVRWVQSTAEICEAVFTHKEYAPEGFTVRVTFAELDKAGVTRGREGVKKNWRCFPRQMLRARAISEGVRAVDPGIVVGIYTPEEISDFDAREVPLETTARVVEEKPLPARAAARKVADELVGQLNAAGVKDRHAPVVTTAAEIACTPKPEPAVDQRPYTTLIFEACQAINAWWRETAAEEGFEYVAAVNQHQVENHLATWALDHKPLAKDHFDGENGTRDRKKVVAFLAKWHAKYPDEFEQLVRDYCEGKLKLACAEKNLVYDVTDEPEGESQEAAPLGEPLDVEFEEVADDAVSEAERKWSES